MSDPPPSPAFAFHAASPPGEWINDPNGLAFADGRYRLFVQHRADAPDFHVTGWARLSSDDLLHWEWDGQVLAPDALGWAYSGSVVAGEDGSLAAFHTRHRNDEGPLQTQHRSTSLDAGLTWTSELAPIGPSGRNVRDPFVFNYRGGQRMLVARPCDWTTWADEPASTLEILTDDGAGTWKPVATIGPWAERGEMWEVPLLLEFGSCWALIVSVVGRRAGATCRVDYWLGAFDGAHFELKADFPREGRVLDLGLDFYACVANTIDGWPDTDRVLVGWASSWATARSCPWPGAAGGGPISLPRRLSVNDAGTRLVQEPPPAAWASARSSYEVAGGVFRLTITSSAGTVRVSREADTPIATLDVERSTNDSVFDCVRRTRLDVEAGAAWILTLFVDGPLVELFVEPFGLFVTVVLPGADHEVVFTPLTGGSTSGFTDRSVV